MKKLLKFDIIHPPEYFEKKIKEWKDLDQLTLKEYRERLLSLRSNYSDYYTYHLNQTGKWEAEEFFLLDPVYLEKAARELYGNNLIKLKIGSYLRKKIRGNHDYYKNQIIHDYIERFQPDVIFARSQPLPSWFWARYKQKALIVARLSARLPKRWHPNDWDLIYTDQPDFQKFFELHGVKTIINDQGFDQRICDDLRYEQKKYETTFVGGLGTQNFKKRTEFIKNIAGIVDFKWWGYWWKYGGDGRKLSDFENLDKTYQGFTSGLDMYQIYVDSKICLNDYVDTANGIGFNQRMFEVMGVGGFLLTREAPNFKNMFPKDIFVTYTDQKDCLDKIAYYLKNSEERDEIATRGKNFIADNYDYSRIALEFGKDLEKELEQKFN